MVRFGRGPAVGRLGLYLVTTGLLLALMLLGFVAHSLLLQLIAVFTGLIVVLAAQRRLVLQPDLGVAVPSLVTHPPRRKTASPLTPRQLPTASALLVGRDELVKQAGDYLLSPAAVRPRVVVLHGPGGVGKTELAVTIAHAVAKSFPDGQLFANLQASEEGKAVERALAKFVSALRDDPVSDDPQRLRQLYAAATVGKSILVVLDDVASADQVADLMVGGHHGAVIITAHQPPRISPSQLEFLIEPLEGDQALRIFREIVGEQRVDAELSSAAELVRHTAGMPLAVRAAAAMLAATPGTRFETALRHYRRYLADNRAGEAPQALDFAYSQLPEPERRTLRAIGMLGSLTIERWQLAALLGVSNAAASRTADRLCQANFLVRDSGDSAGLTRYRIHAHVLVFARQRLSASDKDTRGDLQQMLDSARGVMAERAADHDEVRRGPLSELDRGLILGAINHARDSVESARETGDLLGEGLALAVFAEVRTELGNFDAAEDLAGSAIARAGHEPLVKMRALRCRARLARRRKQWQHSASLLRDALTLSPGHRAERAQCLRDLALTLIWLNRLPEARSLMEQAFALVGGSEGRLAWLLPRMYWVQSLLHEHSGQHRESLTAIQQGLAAAGQAHQDLWVAWLELRRSVLLIAMGDWGAASQSAFLGMEKFANMNHRYGKANAGMYAGLAFLRMENEQGARRILEDSLETFVNCGDKWAEAETRRLLAESVIGEDAAAAAELFATATNLFGAVGDHQSAAGTRSQVVLLERDAVASPD